MSESTRPSFTDAQGQVWSPRIDIDCIDKYETATGIGLAGLQQGEDPFHGRVGALVRLAWLACAKQVRERRVDYVDFGARVMHPDVLNPMIESITQALNDFFPKPATSPAKTTNTGPGPGATTTP